MPYNNNAHALEGSIRLYHCARCLIQMKICTACDRGNIYCSQACSTSARQYSRCAASTRYQLTIRGKQNHALCQRRYREKQLAKVSVKNGDSEKVIDQGSLSNPRELCSPMVDEGLAESKETPRYCDFCGHQCNPYTRRGFLNDTRRLKVILSSSPMAFAQGP